MKLEVLSRYRQYRGNSDIVWYFAIFPYLQVRRVVGAESTWALCLAWLFWSLRMTYKK